MQTCYSPGKPQDPPIRPGCRSNKSRRGSANKSPPAAGGSRPRPYAPVQNAGIAGKKIYFWRKKMKKSKFKLFAALLLAAAMTVLSLSGAAPVLADETAAILANAAKSPAVHTAPEGYDQNDFNKVRTFLEQTDSNGIRNGEKLNPDGYDPDDPESWGALFVDEWDFEHEAYFDWEEVDGINRMFAINLTYIKDFAGTFDMSGLDALSTLDVDGGNFTTADLSNCYEMTHCYFANSTLSSVNFFNCANVTELYLQDNELTEVLNLGDCTSLLFLDILMNNGLEEIDLSGCERIIEHLDFSQTKISDVNETEMFALCEFSCESSGITELDLRNCNYLNYVNCNFCDMDFLYLPELPNNLAVNCMETGLTELNYENCGGIYDLSISGNPGLTGKLNLASNPYLMNVSADNCGFTEIDAAGCEALEGLDISGNNISGILDLSDCKQLLQLYTTGNKFTEIRWHHNSEWYRQFNIDLEAQPGGYVNCSMRLENDFAVNYFEANAKPGFRFNGWYSNGSLVSETPEYSYDMFVSYELTAGFEPVFYDVNGDGLANTEDAIHIARHALQLETIPAEYLPNADLDGDGRITIADAIIALRLTLGIA